ncbi:hypothetical protein COJ46_21960, partial [Bacillus sp. AFS077874]|uniref:hypothetical protein n=1 Tax=Bacillus sp. AFS077874 TaxID=2033513 RepID=UPI000C016DE3
STLLTEMNISARYSGLKLKDRFDEILDELQQNGIFEEWHYEESFSEPTSAKKKWIDEYWSKLKVMIEPLEIVKKENKKKIELNNLPYAEQDVAASKTQLPIPEILVEENSHHRNEEKTRIELSPELLQQAIRNQGITIKAAANDIGISYATVRRYLGGSSKKLSSASHEKTLQWLQVTSS